ncbi:MAG: hypothetical protein KKD73_01715 [Proteobacteria bacterium]|nr:hypothetical protein [Pseudomonadota bacterium]MBU1640088.1 hypothetical protein [Pseudomonadota bacterium]
MAGITIEQANEHLAAWLACDLAVSDSQEYRVGKRTYTKVDAIEVRKNLNYWQGWVNRLTPGRTRIRRAVPLG